MTWTHTIKLKCRAEYKMGIVSEWVLELARKHTLAMKMEPECPAHFTDLKHKITPSEVRDGSRKACSAPHKSQEK